MKLLILPGMDGSGLLLTDLIDSLRNLTVEVISYPNSDDLDYSQLEKLVQSRLPRGDSFALLAESFSGPIAISLAARRPPGLRGLILSCSFARNPRPVLSKLSTMLSLFPCKGVYLAAIARVLFGRFSNRARRSALRDALNQVSVETLRGRIASVVEVDVSAKLANLDIPILYLRGTEDRLIPNAARRLILEHGKNVRVADIRAPHFLLQTAPTAAATAISEFVGELSPKADI